ncbi:HepT-like ribonuclease domain-containing protein [Sporosarcina sp. Marseille-Q4943]|uniref:HepT-like ribonuclease domain-containing protein n=1 Tax=Sporosarcina sp. Marseille-Q4943 TaxID=2942204 RepID=UPI0021128F96|nr:HepT-like ribonuclease domain-containing protein [Sporosarcina sp. Marseille-Q4943]
MEANLAGTLLNMLGFCNIAVNGYQVLDIDILESILNKHIDDFKQFTKVFLQLEDEHSCIGIHDEKQ